MQPASLLRVESVNVGRPKEVLWKGRQVRTSIFKEPVAGRVAVRTLNLEGDEQADLKVHGGPDMAIYVYPADYYAFWRGQFPELALPWGMFGENLTIWGLRDDTIHIGDRFQVGSARLVVKSPRLPCTKLALKFGRDDMIKRFQQSGFSGFYCAVLQVGEVAAGDVVKLLHRDEHAVSVREIFRLENEDRHNRDLLRRALAVEALPQDWRESFLKRLAQLSEATALDHP
jgi:MOSC domain-containing protein YiiM